MGPGDDVEGLAAHRRRGWLAAAAAAALVAGSAAVVSDAGREGDGGGGDEVEAERPGEPSGATDIDAPGRTRYFAAGEIFENPGGDGAILCLGPILTSNPPQCGLGVPLVGWDSSRVEGVAPPGSTILGRIEVVGTFDGTAFTLTEDARPVDRTDDPPLLDEPVEAGSLRPDNVAPCFAPAGGWTPADPTVWDLAAFMRFDRAVPLVPGFAGRWLDTTTTGSNDPTRAIHVVAVAGDVRAAEAELRELWGGPLCVVQAERTLAELDGIRDVAMGIAEEHGALSASAFADVVENRVGMVVTVPVDGLQERLDDRFGDGAVVIISSVLRRLAEP